MPTYEYECRKCGHRFELFHSIKDETPKRCPRCKGRAVRVPSAGAGILFKGSGFYITDYRSQDYKKKANQEKGESGGKSAESGGKPAESKGAKESKEPKASESRRKDKSGSKQKPSGSSD
jgi:putative FmdB family regulatory protein